MNKEKSSIFFSLNTSASTRHILKNLLGITVEAFSERYLSLPTAVVRITSGSFDHIGERIRGKLGDGFEKLVSCAGREIRLKSVAQAIPTFSMSCFQMTKKVNNGISSSMACYWWSSSIDRRSLHWIDWKSLASPKMHGGMGFRNLETFNLAMLGKHDWRMITSPESLCARVLKGRYFPSLDFLHAAIPRGSSSTWRAIVAGRETLLGGLDPQDWRWHVSIDMVGQMDFR